MEQGCHGEEQPETGIPELGIPKMLRVRHRIKGFDMRPVRKWFGKYPLTGGHGHSTPPSLDRLDVCPSPRGVPILSCICVETESLCNHVGS